jgi:hypothetical protein
VAIELALIVDSDLGGHTRRRQFGAEKIQGSRDPEVHEISMRWQADLVTKRPAQMELVDSRLVGDIV